MTLEKDKEDQSKYHLNYPKPSVLDMRWVNGDSNVVEWATGAQPEIFLGSGGFMKLEHFDKHSKISELFFPRYS